MTWTHLICEECWEKQEGGRMPYRIRDAKEERCCFCGKPTKSGIYVRRDPRELECRR